MKYKETHEKQFPPKGEILKQRWNDYQNQNKLLADNKKAAAAKAAEEKLEQTKTGATVEEIKTEETKEPAQAAATEEVKTAPVVEAAPKKIGIPIVRTDVVDVDKTISTYNGGTTSNYKWSQQMLGVDV